MLKVVGASIVQTRVSSYILAVLAIFGIFLIIFSGSMGSDDDDGIYSATVYWKNKLGYRIEFWGQGNSLNEIPKGSARAYYKPDFFSSGWSKLEIETSVHDPDTVQAYSAGLLEGSLTWQLIYWHWQNTIQSTCQDHEHECDQIREYIRVNSEITRTRSVQLSEINPYWHQVRLFYAQLDGMEMGWKYAVKSSRQHYEIPSEDFLWLNIHPDLEDLAYKFDFPFDKLHRNKSDLSSALLKFTNVSSEHAVHIAHSTGDLYGKMLRVAKHYIFNYHTTDSSNANIVPGTVLTFTGYPGVISSQDDFYIIDSRQKAKHSLIVTGTSINNVNVYLWDKLKPEQQVLTSIRAMVANRLALDGRTWSRYFSHGNSGTNNKQWVILDKSKLALLPLQNPEKIEIIPEGLLWIVEQVPGLIHTSDQSHHFLHIGYWASFGVPFYDSIREEIKNVDPNYGEDILDSYTESPRAQIFSQCHSHCNNLENILHIIKYGIKPTTNHVGARGDLYTGHPIAYGVIDSKILTGTATKIVNFQLTSGPVYTSAEEKATEKSGTDTSDNMEVIPPFKWSSSKFKDVSHVGHPDIWKLSPFRPDWVWI